MPLMHSIAEPVYAKKALLQKDSDAQKKLKLQRVGESVFEKGQWSINDEEVHIEKNWIFFYCNFSR